MKPSSTGDAFAERMKHEYSSNVDDRRAMEEERVAAAQAAVLKQLLKLKSYLRKGKRSAADGKIHMFFGELFEAVQGLFFSFHETLWNSHCLQATCQPCQER